MEERLEKSPQDQQDEKFATAIRDLLAASDQDFSESWQNREFLLEFPGLAVYLIGNKGRGEFSQDQRASLFSLSLKAFLTTKNTGLTGYAFTTDGSVVSRDNKGKLVLQIPSDNQSKILPQDVKTESFTKALTASILLIGMSLTDKEKQRSLLIESYQELSYSRKSNFIDSLGRLLGKNHSVRTWIKENRLDSENGFDWDLELSHLLFFGIYAQNIERLPMPFEMQPDTLENCSLQTRGVILNFALEYAKDLNKGRSSAKLTGFIIKMGQMEMTEEMGEKLELLKQKLSFKMFQSPAI